MKDNRVLIALDPTYLGLIILPTEKCNFRCTYCYEDYQQGKMPDRVVQGIKNLLTNRSGELKRLNVEWFGGEPLLAKDIIFDILSHIKHIQQNNHFLFSSSMTSNGYLLDHETLVCLAQMNVEKYQISFDGYREFHNKKRLIHHRERSFDKIWNNLLLFNDLRSSQKINKGKITIRLHLHVDNQSSLLELAEHINQHLDPQFFSISLKNILHLGGANDSDFATLEQTSNESIRRHQALQETLSHFQIPHGSQGFPMCYAAMPNTFVIRSNGRLAKCTVALNNAKNDLGFLQTDGTFHFDGDQQVPWIKSLQTLDSAVLACPISFVNNYQSGV